MRLKSQPVKPKFRKSKNQLQNKQQMQQSRHYPAFSLRTIYNQSRAHAIIDNRAMRARSQFPLLQNFTTATTPNNFRNASLGSLRLINSPRAFSHNFTTHLHSVSQWLNSHHTLDLSIFHTARIRILYPSTHLPLAAGCSLLQELRLTAQWSALAAAAFALIAEPTHHPKRSGPLAVLKDAPPHTCALYHRRQGYT